MWFNYPGYRGSEEVRFWSKVQVNYETGCWEWRANHIKTGHGLFHAQTRKPKERQPLVWAHRWAYEYCVGPIPHGLEIDHLCRNPKCVNPAHLEPVTSKINSLRGLNNQCAKNARKTHCPKGHAYSGVNSFGGRICKTCQREALRKWRAKNKGSK